MDCQNDGFLSPSPEQAEGIPTLPGGRGDLDRNRDDEALVGEGNIERPVLEGYPLDQPPGALGEEEHGDAALDGLIGLGVQVRHRSAAPGAPVLPLPLYEDVAGQGHDLPNSGQVRDALLRDPLEAPPEVVHRPHVDLARVVGNVDRGRLTCSLEPGGQVPLPPDLDGPHHGADAPDGRHPLDEAVGFVLNRPPEPSEGPLGQEDKGPDEGEAHPDHVEDVHLEHADGRQRLDGGVLPELVFLVHGHQRAEQDEGGVGHQGPEDEGPACLQEG